MNVIQNIQRLNKRRAEIQTEYASLEHEEQKLRKELKTYQDNINEKINKVRGQQCKLGIELKDILEKKIWELVVKLK